MTRYVATEAEATDALRRRCPYCEVAPKEWCVNTVRLKDGVKRTLSTHLHVARWRVPA